MNVAEEKINGFNLIGSLPHVAGFALIGSALYLPDELVADVDFAILLSKGQDAIEYAQEHRYMGWSACGEYDSEGGLWCAVRTGNLNLMLTHDPKFFEGYKLAMEVCKALRLEQKRDRILVCSIVRDGMSADEAIARTKGLGA